MNKLYRSRSDSMIAGVCGGLGEYIGVDPVWVRLFFVFFTIFGDGIGLLIYIVMAILVPRATEGTQPVEFVPLSENPKTATIVGGTLIVMGAFFFLDNLNVPWLRWVDFDTLWPLLLIVGGVVLLMRITRGDKNGNQA